MQNKTMNILIAYYSLVYSGITGGVIGSSDLIFPFMLGNMFRMFDDPHYRCESFGRDMHVNLNNVYLPGTRILLSVFTFHRYAYLWFILCVFPIICMVYSMMTSHMFKTLLLQNHYVTWFGLWRMNCWLLQISFCPAEELELEDKATFITYAIEHGMSDLVAAKSLIKTPYIVCKEHKTEGGMGVSLFSNILIGGDYVIQEKLINDTNKLFIVNAKDALSTFRVITSKDSKILTRVFRMANPGARTDHDAVNMIVDSRGRVTRNIVNSQWYAHPVSKRQVVVNTVIIDENYIAEMDRVCLEYHQKCLKSIPFVGFDIAFTKDHGMIMLEVNLSCNFFAALKLFPGTTITRDYDEFALSIVQNNKLLL